MEDAGSLNSAQTDVFFTLICIIFVIFLVLNPCNLSPCDNRGICKATRNIYECVCKPGYQGRNCEKEINECESSPCYQGATCLDKVCEL